MKNQKTILIHPQGSEIPFDPNHAKRLMANPNNGGWKWKDEPVDVSSPDDTNPEATTTPMDDGHDSSSKDEDNGVGDSSNQGNKKKGKK